jgi:pimeloyl-ACP methyl ester carboxylesterase
LAAFVQTITTPELEIAYLEGGPDDGPISILVHGFPYDVHSFDEVAAILNARGIRTIVPHVRGYGPTRFLDEATPRSGQQAAIGQDLLDLIDGLGIERAVVGGFDWGSRAASIAAAIRPERIAGLVIVGGYPIQDIAASGRPAAPHDEYADWYQYYFLTARGRAGLTQNRDDLCRLLWQLWSPEWPEAAAAFERSRASLANPDFVEVVLNSYRHRHAAVPGLPRYAATEAFLATQPPISVPTIALDALADGFGPDDSEPDRPRFTSEFEVRRVPGVGHNLPQEAPQAFADAVTDLVAGAGSSSALRR